MTMLNDTWKYSKVQTIMLIQSNIDGKRKDFLNTYLLNVQSKISMKTSIRNNNTNLLESD
ncbi:hypothetical protein J4206_07285 [Candidatus Woesearchaeota archaeon]|nr:hypothetical protein [Candidatus Woesearchaeota archaeon]